MDSLTENFVRVGDTLINTRRLLLLGRNERPNSAIPSLLYLIPGKN